MGYNITVKRCPECNTTDIYRRIRRDGLSKLTKGKRRIVDKKTITKYVCRICGHEFDIPLVEPKNVREMMKNER